MDSFLPYQLHHCLYCQFCDQHWPSFSTTGGHKNINEPKNSDNITHVINWEIIKFDDTSGLELKHTSSSSGALDSLAAVLKLLGVKETEIQPEDLGPGTDFANISLFLSVNGGDQGKQCY